MNPLSDVAGARKDAGCGLSVWPTILSCHFPGHQARVEMGGNRGKTETGGVDRAKAWAGPSPGWISTVNRIPWISADGKFMVSYSYGLALGLGSQFFEDPAQK